MGTIELRSPPVDTRLPQIDVETALTTWRASLGVKTKYFGVTESGGSDPAGKNNALSSFTIMGHVVSCMTSRREQSRI